MIIVFAGAGSSASINKLDYPTTVEFYNNNLPDDVKSDLRTIVDGHLYSYLSKIKKNNDVIDIEKVLWAINKLWEDFHKCTNANTVTGHVVSENYPDFWKFVVQSNTSLEGLANRIHEQVYKIYSKIPGDSHIEDLATFLCNIQGFYPAIEIFTTNYDLVLDRIIEQYNINVELGHKRGDVGMTILDMAAWHHPGELLKGDLGRLTKLHGSVNWKRENGNVVVGSTHYTGDDRNHPILYPGFKGEPTREPFASFHKHLEKVARKARAAIFIGFSFRDEYINRILRGVPKEAPKYIINKKELQVDTLPFGFPFEEGSYIQDSTGFNEAVIGRCLLDLKGRLGNS